MSLNQNSHFSRAPQANIPRSRFNMSHGVTQTLNAGYLVPFETKEILPGDTFEVDTSILARMQTLTVPLMGDIYLDCYYFYVPNRLLWKNWEHFCGENDEPWFDETQYTIPKIVVDCGPGAQGVTTSKKHVEKGTVADYLGMPLAPETNGQHTIRDRVFNHLPFRAYVKIWNDWFRNENTQALAAFNTEDNNVTMQYDGEAFYGGKLLPVNKYRDYFTSCLPLPQRGNPVTLDIFNGDLLIDTNRPWQQYPPVTGSKQVVYFGTQGNTLTGKHQLYTESTSTGNYNGQSLKANNSTTSINDGTPIWQNWSVNIDGLSPVSINDLRNAFSMQRYLEALALHGSRYIEMLSGIYGVDAGDARLQRSEFLGGNRIRININQAIQQSETQTTPLGNIGAYSVTSDNQSSFTKSFVEHGWLLGLCCVRYDHAYQNGYERFWRYSDFDDIYNPYFANIGEQPVYNYEIYCDGYDGDLEVFGYQEAWAHYRYANNRVAGEMRSNYAQSLDYWHLADDYTERPYLDDEWSKENGETIDRAIAVSQRVSDQFLVDFYITEWATRPMPLYSVPGLDIL